MQHARRYSPRSCDAREKFPPLAVILFEYKIRHRDILWISNSRFNTDHTNEIVNFFYSQDALILSFDHFRKILKSSRKNYLANVRLVYNDLAIIMKEIESLTRQRLQDLWPDIVLQVTCGGTLIANCRLNPIDYMFSPRMNCAGRLSGKRHQLICKVSLGLVCFWIIISLLFQIIFNLIGM